MDWMTPLTIVLLIGIVLLVALMVGKRDRRIRLYQSKSLYITNDTSSTVNIKVDDKHIIVKPDHNIKIILRKGSIIEGKGDKFIFTDPSIKQLIITENGIENDQNITPNTRIVNDSNETITLTFNDRFRKIYKIELSPYSEIRGPSIRKNQKWNIEGKTADTLTIVSLPKRKIVWNGSNLH